MLCCLTIVSSYAGGTDYYMGKGRVAISSDGNKHDDDDIHATKMTLMILAKAGLQNKTTLYTYADHVWGSERNDLELMRNSAEMGGYRFGFNACKFMAAVEDPEAAYEAMAEEIAKSTADDPLFIIAGGPMHVVGMGFEIANETNPDALNYVTVISHSKWNNEHSDKYETKDEPHGKEDPHSGWTWDEMVRSFGSKVNYNYISDQNGTGPNGYQTKDKFKAPSWNSWAWMNTHKDPNVQWVYNHDNITTAAADYSDAGMTYYMVADLDGERGDEFGNPEKLRQWVGEDIIPVVVDDKRVWGVSINPEAMKLDKVGDTKQLMVEFIPSTAENQNFTCQTSNDKVFTITNSGLITAVGNGVAIATVITEEGSKKATATITVGEVEAGEVTVAYDFIAFEAESSTSLRTENWVVRTPDDPMYAAIDGEVDPVNETYLEYVAGSTSGLGVTKGQDMLQYKFTPKSTGVYKLTGRMAQRLTQPSSVAPGDQCNDIHIKMEGDFTSGNPALTTIQLENWQKFYGRGKDKWGSFCKVDINHDLNNVAYQLEEGKEYVFSISARSKGVCIDYFLLSRANITFGENIDLAAVNDARLRPGGDTTFVNETYKSIEFDRFANMGDSLVNATIDATRQCLQIPDRLKWAAAETEYKGEDANVFITLTTLLETDGESTFRVFVGGEKVAEVTNPKIHGTDTKDYTVYTHKIGSEKVAVKKGDIIRVEFNSATNGLVPEGTTTATSRGRWKSISLSSSTLSTGGVSGGSTGGSTGGTPSAELLSHTAPSVVYSNSMTQDITIKYNAESECDYEITLHDITTPGWITNGLMELLHVPLEVGLNKSKVLTVNFINPLKVGYKYRWAMYFTNPGGTWKDYPNLFVEFIVKEGSGLAEVTSVIKMATVFDDYLEIESDEKIESVEFLTLQGQMVSREMFGQNRVTVNTQSLPKGVQLVVIRMDNGNVMTHKVVKQ